MNFTERPTTTASKTTYDRFRPFKTHKAGIVARIRCCELNQADLSPYALKRPFVKKRLKAPRSWRSTKGITPVKTLQISGLRQGVLSEGKLV